MGRGILCALTALLIAAAPAAAAGPSLREPLKDRLGAISCDGDLAGAPGAPVLLVHGTGVTAQENWSWGYEQDLLHRGHGVCTVDLPQRGWVDAQRSVEYVVTAIRRVHRRSDGRRVDVIGHSQGAVLPVFALREWPDLARAVDDFVGLSGLYERGSDAIGADCADRSCVASFWQFRPGSRLLRALVRRPVPAGPSYTAIGTLADEVVTPQPAVNALPGGRSVEIQDVCPGRRFAQDHVFMAADAVAHALVLDALDHPGPADPARVDPATCAFALFPDADLVRFAQVAPQLARSLTMTGPEVGAEPRVRCAFRPGCRRRAAHRG